MVLTLPFYPYDPPHPFDPSLEMPPAVLRTEGQPPRRAETNRAAGN